MAAWARRPSRRSSRPPTGAEHGECSVPDRPGANSTSSRSATDGARRLDVAPAPQSRDGGMFAGEPVLDGRYGAVGYNVDRRVGSRTIVYVTTDRGRDWHPVIPPGPAEPWLVDTLTARRWRLFYGGQILVTGNMGRTWRTITTNHRFPALFYALTPPLALLLPSHRTGLPGLSRQSRRVSTRSGEHSTAAVSGTG